MTRFTLAMVLMLVLVERSVSFTAVDASWGKRSEKVRTCKYTTCTCMVYISSSTRGKSARTVRKWDKIKRRAVQIASEGTKRNLFLRDILQNRVYESVFVYRECVCLPRVKFEKRKAL